jgi:[ribosomal protein S18]-alanine N-acetyltransferase
MPDVEIKVLTADHLPAVIAIENASFKDPWTMTSFRDLMIQSRMNWAALSDGKVAGYLITQWVLDEIHILNVAVSADYRRKGIASCLMDFLLETGQQQNMQVIYLEVRVTNTPAITFYQKYGFSILATRKRYYRDGENAYIMHRRFTGKLPKQKESDDIEKA